MSTATGPIKASWHWWVETLKACIPTRLNQLWPELRIFGNGDGYALELHALGKTCATSARSGRRMRGDAAIHETLLAATRALAIKTLLLPDEQVLKTTIELPRLASAHLRDAIKYQLSARVPFDDDDTCFDHVVLESGIDEALNVDVFVCSARAIEWYRDRVKEAGLLIDRVACRRFPGLDLRPTRFAKGRSSQDLRPNAACCGLIVALLLSLATITQYRLSDEIETWKEATERLQKESKSATELADKIKARTLYRRLPLEKRARLLSSVAAVSALANALPPEAWIVQLSFSEGEISFNAFAPDSASLLQAIEAAEQFDNARFAAPATRDVNASMENVHISANLVAPQ